jgi:hypothetical protein
MASHRPRPRERSSCRATPAAQPAAPTRSPRHRRTAAVAFRTARRKHDTCAGRLTTLTGSASAARHGAVPGGNLSRVALAADTVSIAFMELLDNAFVVGVPR